jgi:hypothetical protein
VRTGDAMVAFISDYLFSRIDRLADTKNDCTVTTPHPVRYLIAMISILRKKIKVKDSSSSSSACSGNCCAVGGGDAFCAVGGCARGPHNNPRVAPSMAAAAEVEEGAQKNEQVKPRKRRQSDAFLRKVYFWHFFIQTNITQ